MPISNPATLGVISKAGTYSGNSTVNRAIPHGCGSTPKIIFIERATAVRVIILGADGLLYYHDDVYTGTYTVTIPDSTNFYVGNATSYLRTGNMNAVAYRWVAIV